MPKTLAAYKLEFDALKKMIRTGATEMQSLETSNRKHGETIDEGMQTLGLRIHDLRAAGTVGATLADFMGDKEVAVMARELSNLKEQRKSIAVEFDAFRKSKRKPILDRMTALQNGLQADIAARDQKTSSKLLGINQSVKEMKTLLDAVVVYSKRTPNADFVYVKNMAAKDTPAQVDQWYNQKLAAELAKSQAQAAANLAEATQHQLFNLRLVKVNLTKARPAQAEVAKQAELAQAAQKARNLPGLAAAKKAAAAGLVKVKAVVDPYVAAEKDADLMDALKKSQDGPAALKAVGELLALLHEAEGDNDETQGRRLA